MGMMWLVTYASEYCFTAIGIIPFSVIFSPFHPDRYFGGWEQLNFSVVENVVKTKK